MSPTNQRRIIASENGLIECSLMVLAVCSRSCFDFILKLRLSKLIHKTITCYSKSHRQNRAKDTRILLGNTTAPVRRLNSSTSRIWNRPQNLSGHSPMLLLNCIAIACVQFFSFIIIISPQDPKLGHRTDGLWCVNNLPGVVTRGLLA